MAAEAGSASQGIHSLPTELICSIFFSVHSSIHRKAQKTAPVHTLTRVCRFWRALSQGLPELWSDIRIFHCRPGHPDMVGEYLRRSNLLPVDIRFQVSSDIAANQMTVFWSTILAIWAVSTRWRTLRIITTAKNFSAMEYNVGRKDAPLLESLELRVSESQSYQPSLSFGSMPLLGSLVVHEITPRISDTTQFFGQLETLDLLGASNCTHLVVDLAQRFEDASQDTQMIPRLRHLSLRSGIPSLHGAFGVAFKSYISSLRTLTLGDFTGHNFQTLCSLLSVPFLEELTIHDLGYGCWATFTATLRDHHLTFPALRTLKLFSIDGGGFHRYLIDAFPALEHLSLLDTASAAFCSALSKPDSSPSYPVLWPQLRSLTLNNADYRVLCVVVEARSAMGHAIEVLEVDTPLFIDAPSLQWLQKHVKTLRRTPLKSANSSQGATASLDYLNHI
ncbi:hypothetical protein B0H16DRAFT_1590339 [Mycena metata]|uniref:F-box domain-containing protein n=1 Tax=Mycena metata TaxID=1033252 RepID=A0AAD7HUJ8_9AGAR|nr:hypothetical protein B0H16DRAFT_1590339 [Mycena metata]